MLYSQKVLKTMVLRTIFNSSSATKENALNQFKLKNLSLLSFEENERFNDEDLKEFLYTQKDSVEALELGRTFSNDVYELILNKFVNLKTLRIDISAFPADLGFYKRINAVKNVTKLIIHGENGDTVLYCTILNLFPNATDISFSSRTLFELFSWLSKCCIGVTSLTLDRFCPGYRNVNFSALKNFRYVNFNDEQNWCEFVMSNRIIESLCFDSIC